MSHRTTGVRGWALTLLASAQLCGIGALAAESVVQVADEHGRVVAGFPVQPGDRWCLAWNHSVAGFTVRDCFVFRPPDMLLESSHQPDFAAGLGYTAGRGVLRADGQGGYLIDGIDEPVAGNRLSLRVGPPMVDHRIEFAGGELALSDLAANRRVEIRLITAHGPPGADAQ